MSKISELVDKQINKNESKKSDKLGLNIIVNDAFRKLIEDPEGYASKLTSKISDLLDEKDDDKKEESTSKISKELEYLTNKIEEKKKNLEQFYNKIKNEKTDEELLFNVNDDKMSKEAALEKIKHAVDKCEKEMVNHPDHYQTKNGIEVIDVIEAFDLGFNLGNVVKYVLRCGKKDAEVQELEKAKWYLEREIENRKAI